MYGITCSLREGFTYLQQIRVRLGMQQPDPQVRVDNLSMFVSKRFALIGVRLIGNPAPLDRLLERVMEGIAVCC